MKNFLITILTSTIITFASLWLAINLTWQTFGMETELLGSTLTTINATDKISTLPTNLNANFTALNTDKLERSDFFATTSLPSITTLSSLSSVGTITSGTWNADTLTVAYGGTGSTTLSANKLLVGNGANAINSLGDGTVGQFLTASTTGNLPYWSTSAIDEAGNYDWTGNHTFAEATIASSTFTGTTVINYPTASSSIASKGYVDEKVLYGIQSASSSNLRVSDNTGESSSETSYTKIKEIQVYVAGNMRIDFDIKRELGSGSVYGKIYVDGVAVGTERSTAGTDYVNYSQEISGIKNGSLVQVYGYVGNAVGGTEVYIANFRLYFDVSQNTSWGTVK